MINWKEMADQMTTDELMLEIDQALEASNDEDDDDVEIGEIEELREPDPVTDWADGPASDPVAAVPEPETEDGLSNVPELELDSGYELELDESFEDEGEDESGCESDEDPDDDLPSPLFGTMKAAGLSVPRKVPIDL